MTDNKEQKYEQLTKEQYEIMCTKLINIMLDDFDKTLIYEYENVLKQNGGYNYELLGILFSVSISININLIKRFIDMCPTTEEVNKFRLYEYCMKLSSKTFEAVKELIEAKSKH